MMRVDEALLMRWKDRLCDEIDEIYHEENWTPQHAKSMKEMLSSVEKIICIIKCAKEMDESGMQGEAIRLPHFFVVLVLHELLPWMGRDRTPYFQGNRVENRIAGQALLPEKGNTFPLPFSFPLLLL